jgi:hypothetical protein
MPSNRNLFSHQEKPRVLFLLRSFIRSTPFDYLDECHLSGLSVDHLFRFIAFGKDWVKIVFCTDRYRWNLLLPTLALFELDLNEDLHSLHFIPLLEPERIR